MKRLNTGDYIKVRKRFSNEIIIVEVLYVFYRNNNTIEKILTEDNFDSGTFPEDVIEYYTKEEYPEYFL